MPTPVIDWIAPGIGFAPEAARSFRRLTASLGRRPGCNSSYRDWDLQLSMYHAWNAWVNGAGPYPGHSRAIHPDYSMHCKGLALDSNDWSTPGFNALAAEHGWIRTMPNDPTERHHFEYQSWNDQHRNEPAPSGEEEDMTPEQDRRLSAVFQAIFGAVNVPPAENPNGQITWLKPNGEKPGAAQYGLMDISIHNQKLINDVLARPEAVVSDAQVKAIADAVAAQIGKPTVTLDYAAIARAVNDDVSARMKQ